MAPGQGTTSRADFRAGLDRLTAMGLSLDALVYHHQHADLLDLARACPDANIVMNHTGMPLGYGALRRQAEGGARPVAQRRCPRSPPARTSP